MTKIRNGISMERLHTLLTYDKKTGVFQWKSKHNSRRPDSAQAGSFSSGRWQIQIDKVIYLSHRLAWLYVTGHMPTMEIDHINGDPSDNRFCNLRHVDSSTNKENRHKTRTDSKSGLIGAFINKRSGKWRSSIKVKGKEISLGYFNTPEEASAAYLAAKDKHHFGSTI